MTTVWVVTVGVYSDARVHGVFTDEMAAIDFCRQWDEATWEAFELDAVTPDAGDSWQRATGQRIFVVSDKWYDLDGDVRRWYGYNQGQPAECWTEPGDGLLQRQPGAHLEIGRCGEQWHSALLWCADPDPVRARKMFTEQRAMLLADWTVIMERAERDGTVA